LRLPFDQRKNKNGVDELLSEKTQLNCQKSMFLAQNDTFCCFAKILAQKSS